MRNGLVLGVWLAWACVGPCFGEEYLLTIEEVEGLQSVTEDGMPPVSMSATVPPPVQGWLELNKDALAKMNALKTTELLISTDSRFHLRIEEAGRVTEMNGRVQKVKTPAAKTAPAASEAKKTGKTAGGPPRPDVILEIDFKQVSEPNGQRSMKIAMPMQCGKQYRFPSDLGQSSTTIWSVYRADQDK